MAGKTEARTTSTRTTATWPGRTREPFVFCGYRGERIAGRFAKRHGRFVNFRVRGELFRTIGESSRPGFATKANPFVNMGMTGESFRMTGEPYRPDFATKANRFVNFAFCGESFDTIDEARSPAVRHGDRSGEPLA
ncbi:MAG: hypothetical protein FWD17_08575 [Polyangiaceae bacterium]|nr:hypothetical protein [Polyangiaceae bacterium]